jgi:hypothetical protein
MTEWVEVNGARIEKAFFDENVREATSYQWTEIDSSQLTEHVHCMVCAMAVPSELSRRERLYHSSGGHLCGHCYQSYVQIAAHDGRD